LSPAIASRGPAGSSRTPADSLPDQGRWGILPRRAATRFDAPVDFGITASGILASAYKGEGGYAAGGALTNLRLIAKIEERSAEAVIADAIAEALDGPDAIYLSLDIDVIDPGSAPGTGTRMR